MSELSHNTSDYTNKIVKFSLYEGLDPCGAFTAPQCHRLQSTTSRIHNKSSQQSLHFFPLFTTTTTFFYFYTTTPYSSSSSSSIPFFFSSFFFTFSFSFVTFCMPRMCPRSARPQGTWTCYGCCSNGIHIVYIHTDIASRTSVCSITDKNTHKLFLYTSRIEYITGGSESRILLFLFSFIL